MNIPEPVKTHIINEIITSIKDDISYTIRNRLIWSRVSVICETFSKLSVVAGTILSFLAGTYSENLNIYAGLSGVLSIVFSQFAAYANLQDHISTIEVNEIMKKLNINYNLIDISQNYSTVSSENNNFQNKSDRGNRGDKNKDDKNDIDIEAII